MALLQLNSLQTASAPINRRRTTLVAAGLDLALGGQGLQVVAPGQDPISVISAALREAPSHELHLVAHGAPGQIQLGLGIDRSSLLARAAEIGGWGVERIYLWSCRVGADLNFVSALQELSGARVFASAEALGQGKALMGSDFPELAAAVAALPFELEITGNVNFDNVNTGSYGTYISNYSGLNWSNVYVVDGLSTGWGYATAVTSGRNVALNASGSPASINAPGAETFSLQSVNLTVTTAASASVNISGYLDGNYVYGTTVCPGKLSDSLRF